jgi:hypothetical protein
MTTERKTKTLSLRLKPSTLKRIRQLATRHGVSMAEIIEGLVNDYWKRKRL